MNNNHKANFYFGFGIILISAALASFHWALAAAFIGFWGILIGIGMALEDKNPK